MLTYFSGPSERINVKVTVNNHPQQPPATVASVDISNVSPSSSGGPQTLADLKKQRSMNRVAQQNSPQAPIRENNSAPNSQMRNHHHPPEDTAASRYDFT